jgi:Flp pilus assembly protein TadG
MRSRKITSLSLLNCRRQLRGSLSGAGLLDSAGQGLVELALTVPLFTLLLVGAAELASVAWASIEVSNAARAGAQYGIQSHITASSPATITAVALADGTNLNGLTVTSATNFCTCSTAPATTIDCAPALTTCASPAIIHEFVQVQTSATVTPLFHLPGLPRTFTPTGSAIMEVEQ